MTAAPKLMSFVATAHPAKAINFYRDILGPVLHLRLTEDTPFALVFDCGGTMLRVQKVEKIAPAQYTSLGWQVSDIRATIRSLSAAGVKFSRYPGLPQDDDGIWTTPDGSQVAWFNDPDGNILSLTQFAA